MELKLSELIKVAVAAWLLNIFFYHIMGTDQWFSTVMCICMGLFWKHPVRKDFGKTEG
jgi:hypothetical protein